MKIAILGSGNGGHIFAADLSLAGHEIYWCKIGDNSNESWDFIKQTMSIELQGEKMLAAGDGIANITLMTNKVQEAIQDVEVIFVITTANRHKEYIDALLECNLEGKTVVFMPGRYACLLMQNELAKRGMRRNFYLGETSCFPFANRIIKPGVVRGYACKKKLPFAAFPASDTSNLLTKIKPYCPILIPVENVLVTSMMDHCSIMHPIAILNNVEKIADPSNAGKIIYYGYDERMGEIADKVDLEKLNILNAIGVQGKNIPSILRLFYEANGCNTYQAIRNVKCYGIVGLPNSIDTRYLSEDVPFGIVPMYRLASLLQIDCPHMQKIIESANVLSATNYLDKGYTLEALGIAGMSTDELQHYLNNATVLAAQFEEESQSVRAMP